MPRLRSERNGLDPMLKRASKKVVWNLGGDKPSSKIDNRERNIEPSRSRLKSPRLSSHDHTLPASSLTPVLAPDLLLFITRAAAVTARFRVPTPVTATVKLDSVARARDGVAFTRAAAARRHARRRRGVAGAARQAGHVGAEVAAVVRVRVRVARGGGARG